MRQSILVRGEGGDRMSLLELWLNKQFTRKAKYSDTWANEDNSFRNHIRWPKSSLAET